MNNVTAVKCFSPMSSWNNTVKWCRRKRCPSPSYKTHHLPITVIAVSCDCQATCQKTEFASILEPRIHFIRSTTRLILKQFRSPFFFRHVRMFVSSGWRGRLVWTSKKRREKLAVSSPRDKYCFSAVRMETIGVWGRQCVLTSAMCRLLRRLLKLCAKLNLQLTLNSDSFR